MEKLSISDTPLKASCHCGAVTLTTPKKPTMINECQCTICRRYAAAWSYYDPAEVDITIKEGSSVKKYVWGDKQISFNWCEDCGCMCYWYPYATDPSKDPHGGKKMGINTRMVDPAELGDVNRILNHKGLYAAISVKEAAHPEDRAKY